MEAGELATTRFIGGIKELAAKHGYNISLKTAAAIFYKLELERILQGDEILTMLWCLRKDGKQ